MKKNKEFENLPTKHLDKSITTKRYRHKKNAQKCEILEPHSLQRKKPRISHTTIKEKQNNQSIAGY